MLELPYCPMGTNQIRARHENDDGAVCVLCGRPWEPRVKNVCECGGFCSWGRVKGGPPSSWTILSDGSWTPKPVPREAEREVG